MEKTLSTLGEYIDSTTSQLASTAPDARPVFRGMQDATWSLETGLDRIWKKSSTGKKHVLEQQLIRDFRQRAHSHLTDTQSRWYPLMIGQHYGLPTRLLDWTFSPLVAAHFATLPRDSQDEEDRVVWSLDTQALHRAFSLKPRPYTTTDLLPKEKDGRTRYQKTFSPEPGERAMAFVIDPPALDPRVGAQLGAFTVSSQLDMPLDAFLRAQGLATVLTRMIIPADCVARFRDQLDMAGVLERDLFPDLEGIAREIRRRASKPRIGIEVNVMDH